MNPAAAESHHADDVGSVASADPDSEERSIEDSEFVRDTIPRSRSSVELTRAHLESQSCTGGPSCHGRNGIRFRAAASDSDRQSSSRKVSDVDAILSAEPEATVEPEVSSKPTPTLVWRTVEDIVDRFAANSHEKRAERARGVLNAPVIQVFNLLFVGNWLQVYHDTSNNRDATFSEWYRASDGYMTRDVTFRRPLGYKIGPKETRVKETQRYSFLSNGGVLIELEGQNLDAPYGDYFVVESFFELTPHEDGTKTLFIASIAVHFFKSTILRGKIESGAMSETKKAFQNVLALAMKTIEEAAAFRAPRLELPIRQVHKRTNEGTAADLMLPSSPTKKMRSTNSLPMVAPVQSQSQPVADVVRTLSRPSIPSMSSMPAHAYNAGVRTVDTVDANIEVQDSQSTKALRIVGVVTLVLACLLLFGVFILLVRMQRSVSVLEKLMNENLRPAQQCSP